MTTAVVTNDFKSNMKYYFDLTADGHSVIITRPKRRNAVLISEAEYNELKKFKTNAEYMYTLNKSIAEAKAGKVVIKTMDELEALANG